MALRGNKKRLVGGWLDGGIQNRIKETVKVGENMSKVEVEGGEIRRERRVSTVEAAKQEVKQGEG